MNKLTLPRLGAACGAVFAIVLTVAAGNGNQSFSGPRAVAGIAAITLALPFIAYLCSVLREAEGADGWLVSTAFAGGITGIVLKLGSGAPELAMYKAHLIAGTQLNTAINAIGDGATVICLLSARRVLRGHGHRRLPCPRFPALLAAGAAVTAATLAINGAFLGSIPSPPCSSSCSGRCFQRPTVRRTWFMLAPVISRSHRRRLRAQITPWRLALARSRGWLRSPGQLAGRGYIP